MENTLEGIKSRLDETEDHISELEDKVEKKHPDRAIKQTKKRLKTNEDSLRELWDDMKCNNIHIIGIPEGGEMSNR